MKPPSISVILISSKRKNFILQALNSLANQTMSRERFEIICVKNFTDQNLDQEIMRYSNAVINSNDLRYGIKVSEAILVSKGEIICFLDDDDMFSHDKLERVSLIFSENPQLNYYHNGRTTDHEEFLNQGSRKSKVGNSRVLNLEKPNFNETLSFFRLYPDFNSSSISIRRKVLDGKIGHLKNLIMHPDTFFLFCALETEGILIEDPKLLTFYRLHQSTTNDFHQNIDDFYSNKFHYYESTNGDWKVITSILKKEVNLKLCRCEMVHNAFLRGIFNKDISSKDMFKLTNDFFKCIYVRKIMNMIILLIIGYLITFFPRTGRRFYYNMSIRFFSR